jgi:hypothetical protein
MSNLTERYAQRAITKTLGVHLGVQGIKNAILKANINFLKTNKVTRLFLIHNNSCVIIRNRTHYKHAQFLPH